MKNQKEEIKKLLIIYEQKNKEYTPIKFFYLNEDNWTNIYDDSDTIANIEGFELLLKKDEYKILEDDHKINNYFKEYIENDSIMFIINNKNIQHIRLFNTDLNKKNKIYKTDFLKSENVINNFEKNFIESIVKKKSLTSNQREIRNKIIEKIKQYESGTTFNAPNIPVGAITNKEILNQIICDVNYLTNEFCPKWVINGGYYSFLNSVAQQARNKEYITQKQLEALNKIRSRLTFLN